MVNIIDDFELNSEGNVKTSPLVEYAVTPVAGMFALVRVKYTNSEDTFDTSKWENLQLAVTPVICRALAEALLRAEATLLAQHVPSRSQN